MASGRTWLPRAALAVAVLAMPLPLLLAPGVALAGTAVLLRDRAKPLWPSLPVAALAIVLVASAAWLTIGVPHYLASQKRIAQQECLVGLRAIALAQNEHYGRYKTYATRWVELDYTPAPRTYAFFLSSTERVGPSSLQLNPALRPGITGVCPDCGFRAACVGQLDADAAMDTWSISGAGGAAQKELGVAADPVVLSDDVLQ